MCSERRDRGQIVEGPARHNRAFITAVYVALARLPRRAGAFYHSRPPDTVRKYLLTRWSSTTTIHGMAYLRILKCRYYYIMRSVRHGDKVKARIAEYLGRDPDPKRLKRALEYWGVKRKRKGGR